MIALREFASAREMVEFYRDLIARRNALGQPPAPVLVEIAPDPEPPPPPEAPPPLPRSTMKRIIVAAAQEFDIPMEAVCGPGRCKRDVVVRHVVTLLASELTNFSLCAIGRALNRDHTSVLHAIRSVRRRLAADPILAIKVARVRGRLLQESSEQMTNQGEDK